MKCFKIRKLNNDGAALVFAIVVVMFITILTTMLLYASTMNYEMKTTDYRTTLSFYGAETPLEELRVQLAVDTSAAAEAAYRHVMLNYAGLGDEDMRNTEYQKIFFQNIEKIWTDRRGAADSWVTAITVALQNNSAYDVLMAGSSENSSCAYHIYLGVPDPITGDGGIKLERDEANGRIFLRDIRVMYTENDFVSQISTDFCITVPVINWSVNEASDPAPGMEAEWAVRKEIHFEECVSYMNWMKQ